MFGRTCGSLALPMSGRNARLREGHGVLALGVSSWRGFDHLVDVREPSASVAEAEVDVSLVRAFVDVEATGAFGVIGDDVQVARQQGRELAGAATS